MDQRLFALAVVAALTLLPSEPALAQEIRIQPYLQQVTPDAAWVLWETTSGEESRVSWGPTADVPSEATGTFQPSAEGPILHETQLTGLSPATRYYYQVHTGGASSSVFHFTTAPLPGADVTFRMVAVSDMQNDAANPTIYDELIHQGVIPYLSALEPLLDDALAFVLVPGDLVSTGRVYETWKTEFFDPGADVMSYVPFYPVLGNHEDNSHNYYRYFHLPENGGTLPEYKERWWSLDYANVRLIGLDTNLFLLVDEWEAFFDERVADACTDDNLDFVFVEMHHAHRSELWPDGQQPMASTVVERMNRFSEDCGKPSIHFYGHTHGYSRGQSRDANHLWVNVASAGGNLDDWGEYDNQRDVSEVSISQDEYGFVFLEVTGGLDPSFRLQRISRGNLDTPRDNEVRDEVTIRRFNEGPAAPTPTMPRGRVQEACGTLLASDYADPDGDEHGATHWQVSGSCDDFASPLFERYRYHENWYDGEDTQAGDDLTDEPLDLLPAGVFYCWRVRYRDRSLAWGDWSTPVPFTYDADGVGTGEGCDNPEPLLPFASDAGVGDDASIAAPEASGCGCRVSGTSNPGAPALAALGLVIALFGRRRGRAQDS